MSGWRIIALALKRRLYCGGGGGGERGTSTLGDRGRPWGGGGVSSVHERERGGW